MKTTTGEPTDTHSVRWAASHSAWRTRQMWFALLADDPRFGLAAGDIVRCVNYPHDTKVTVLFREEDGYRPACNQYRSDVRFLAFVPRDMEAIQ